MADRAHDLFFNDGMLTIDPAVEWVETTTQKPYVARELRAALNASAAAGPSNAFGAAGSFNT